MANTLDAEVADVVAAGAGPGLSFIAYPAAMALLPAPQLWAILFFLMMIMLGLDSQYAMVEVVVTGLTDEFPWLAKRKKMLLGSVCILGFLLGLPMTSPGGLFWFSMIDNYSAGLGFIIVAFFLLVSIFMVYGNFVNGKGYFLNDVKDMMGSISGSKNKVFDNIMNYYYQFMWWIGSPAMLLFIIIFTIMNYYTPSLYLGYKNETYEYEMTGQVIAVFLNFTPVIVVILFAGYESYKAGGFVNALKPTSRWGPQQG